MFSKLLRTTTVLCSLLAAACGGKSVVDSNPVLESNTTAVTDTSAPQPESCSREALEQSLSSQLASLETDVDFSFYVENENGETFSFERGTSTLDTPYQSASTSKWVSAAVILQLVDRELLNLSDVPPVYLASTQWSLPVASPLNAITLEDLLSFTSGLNKETLCTNASGYNFFGCVANIARNHADVTTEPGTQFSYGSNHLQVAGAMAVNAGGYANWAELFDDFKSVTGLFPNSYYNLPSTSNPRLAGGMTWTGYDYIDFIRAFRDAVFYSSADIVDLATSDQVGTATISDSPAFTALGEDWRYGFGVWLECHNALYDASCAEAAMVSSPGAYGAYPFLNRDKGYFGIVARQGDRGSFREGYLVFDRIRPTVDAWVDCTAD